MIMSETTTTPARPYADTAALYWRAGWTGVLPLPVKRKASPPSNHTGRAGVDPSRADIESWCDGREGDGNIGLRLPPTVIGIDVDAYSAKAGRATLASWVERCGPLPTTWISTSRSDGVSGIRLFTIPDGLAWPGEIGPGVELVLWSHRYVVVWPSVHPEGNTYRWITPDGVTVATGSVPRVDELPALPDIWIAAVTAGRSADDALIKSTLSDVEVSTWLARHGVGEQCAQMRETVDRYLSTRLTGAASRHDAARDAVARLIFMAAEGHRGAVSAVNDIGMAFRAATEHDDTRVSDQGEWHRLYLGAVRLVTNDDTDTSSEPPPDPCAAPSAVPLLLPSTAPSPVLDISTLSIEQAQELAQARALEGEVRIQRLRRQARALLDGEQAAKDFRVPPSRLNLTAELALPDEPIIYAVADVLPSASNVLLTAQFKTGKTTLINHLARCLVDGLPFLGRHAVTPLTGRVALFNYEVGAGMYRRWLREASIVNTDAVVPLNLRGYSLPLISSHVVDWLVDWLREHDISVWIVDPFARAFTGDNENDNSMVGQFLETLDVIKSRAGVRELVLPVHTGRAEVEIGAERARGATRLDDWADVRWMLTRDDDGARYFSATGRDVDVAEMQLGFDASTRQLTTTGKGNRLAVQLDRIDNQILAAIEATPDMGVREIYRAVHRRHTEIDEALGELIDSGRVRVTIGANRKRQHVIVGPSALVIGMVHE